MRAHNAAVTMTSLADRARVLARALDGALIPAVPVPRSRTGEMAVAAQDAYARWMARQPIGGVAVWAHTGRGLHLDPPTRAAVLASWRRALPHEVVIVAGCGVPRDAGVVTGDARACTDRVIEHTVRMAHEARAGGAAALLVHPPSALAAFPDAAERVVAVHDALQDADLPLIVFLLYDRASGLEYDDVLLGRLLALPHVIGLKVATLNSVMRVQDVMRQMADAFPDRLRISGEDRFLGYSLLAGARAALVGMGAARTGMQAALIRAAIESDWPRFIPLSNACDRFSAVTFNEPMDGYIQRMLWSLAADGVIPDDVCHDPHGPALPETERARVRRVLHTLDDRS